MGLAFLQLVLNFLIVSVVLLNGRLQHQTNGGSRMHWDIFFLFSGIALGCVYPLVISALFLSIHQRLLSGQRVDDKQNAKERPLRPGKTGTDYY